MATNKRKEAAALFELIDKSTLKVPKHTGSLKIPSWWSSKSNTPSGSPGGSPGSIPARQPAPAAEKPLEKPIEAVEEPELAAAEHAPLFDIPVTNGQSSPSIRPPVPTSGSRFASASNGHTNGNGHSNGHAAVLDEPELTDLPIPEESLPAPEGGDGYAGSGNGSRVFAPQTMSQSEGFQGDWLANQKFRLVRSPMWVLVAGASGIVLVVVLILWLVISLVRGRTPAVPVSAAGSPQQQVQPVQQNGNSLLPRPQQPNAQQGVQQPAVDPRVVHQPDPPPARPMPAQVFAGGTVARPVDLYYIVVLTTPTESVARKNADFLAARGVDISIEQKAGTRFYKLVSVKGFPTISDAQPLKKRIVEIGHMLPEYAKSKKAWDDAQIIKWAANPEKN